MVGTGVLLEFRCAAAVGSGSRGVFGARRRAPGGLMLVGLKRWSGVCAGQGDDVALMGVMAILKAGVGHGWG